MNKKYVGFIAPKEGIQSDHWVLGASNTPPFPAIKEDSNWEDQIPTVEKQNKGIFETYNCTGFNTLNSLEILMKYKFGGDYNYSDRWLGIIAGTKAPGNDPHAVSEAIRKYGLIPEAMLPFSDDLKNEGEYYSFKGLTKDEIEVCYAEGRKWLEQYDFKHAWVYKDSQPFDEKLNNMKVGLKSSPLGIAVYAWASDARDVYISMGNPNHWTTNYGVNDFLKVIDTYEPFRKLVEQNIIWCKMYSIEKKEGTLTEEEGLSLWAQILKLWNMVFKLQTDIQKVDKPIPPVVNNSYNEVKESMKPNMIEKWAKAIARMEGDITGHNAGNLKFSPLIQSFGGTLGRKAKDGGYFAIFPDDGIPALCKFLTMACKDELKSYHKARTLQKFSVIYAGNPPQGYINSIAKELGVSLDVDISSFLS